MRYLYISHCADEDSGVQSSDTVADVTSKEWSPGFEVRKSGSRIFLLQHLPLPLSVRGLNGKRSAELLSTQARMKAHGTAPLLPA